MDNHTGTASVCHGVTWATGKPTLLLADAETGHLDHVEITGRTLGFAVTDAARHCTGRYQFIDTYRVEPLACPHQAKTTSGDQCDACAAQDEFRFAHRFHQGGHTPAALQAYMAQPHALYLATFAATVSKVGTAAQPRRASRLDEQGPMHATYLIEMPDGRAVRQLEDTLSTRLGVAQTVRGATKLATLLNPDIERAESLHRGRVERACTVLTELGLAPTPAPWSPPDENRALWHPRPDEQRDIYPHDLRTGEHGFHIDSCLGTRVLARLTPDPDAIRYVMDLNTLKGFKITFGAHASPATETQTALF